MTPSIGCAGDVAADGAVRGCSEYEGSAVVCLARVTTNAGLQFRPGLGSSGRMAEGAAVPRDEVLGKVVLKVEESFLIGRKGFFSGTRRLRC